MLTRLLGGQESWMLRILRMDLDGNLRSGGETSLAEISRRLP